MPPLCNPHGSAGPSIGHEDHGRLRICSTLQVFPRLTVAPTPKTQANSPDGVFAGALADLHNVGPREAVGEAHQEVDVHPRVHGALAQGRLEDGLPGRVVRQGDVDQLVQAPGAQQRAVNDVRPAIVAVVVSANCMHAGSTWGTLTGSKVRSLHDAAQSVHAMRSTRAGPTGIARCQLSKSSS